MTQVMAGLIVVLQLAAGPLPAEPTGPPDEGACERYRFGHGIDAYAPDDLGEFTAVTGIGIAPDGALVASGVTHMGNIALLGLEENHWKGLHPFLDHVTKSAVHDRVATETGKVSFADGGIIVAKVARLDDARIFATEHGIYRHAGKNREKLLEPKQKVLSLAWAEDGTIAFGTQDGLFVLPQGADNAAQLHSDGEDGAWTLRNVSAMVYDSDGALWFSADNGIGAWDGETWTLYAKPQTAPYKTFNCAASGPGGAVWFGTDNGALKFGDGEWTYFAGADWLPHNHVNSIAIDHTGKAWIATDKGIAQINTR